MLHVGLNLNNREALIAPDYGVPDLLSLGERAEELGFDSVWVGDSLFSKPRYEPLALAAALSQRTRRIRLGTACLVTTLRNPLSLAQAWATLDVLSNGRTILGACSGNVAEEAVKLEFAALGLDPRARMALFEEGLQVLRQLLTSGRVTFRGEHFAFDDVAFHTGTEPAPLLPVQTPPPIWVVANPSLGRGRPQGVLQAARRVAALGDGWLTCCRARAPEEVTQFVEAIAEAREEAGDSLEGFTVAYQVTFALGESRREASASQRAYIDAYYPGFSDAVALEDWGPVGTPDDLAAWIATFAEAGVGCFICRFAALDQIGQVEWFARDVLPVVRALTDGSGHS
jgi:alkanesulfonate monooxygenase SsuD/methylene tetrahydromethanopterin reductase-like flavin-dependent oxidoreductase (luciferase family)